MNPSPSFHPLFRRPSILAAVLVGLWAALPVRAVAAPDPVVNVTGGDIRGTTLSDGKGAVFKGIPFAQPPVGELRWREPMPVVPWTGVREADKPGRPRSRTPAGWNDAAAAASSEDCLYLNVWTPVGIGLGKCPVMVWIHGGGNTGGAGGSDLLYDGES